MDGGNTAKATSHLRAARHRNWWPRVTSIADDGGYRPITSLMGWGAMDYLGYRQVTDGRTPGAGGEWIVKFGCGIRLELFALFVLSTISAERYLFGDITLRWWP